MSRPIARRWAVGDQVSIEVTAAGCSQGGHWGYVYVDHFGSFHPGGADRHRR